MSAQPEVWRVSTVEGVFETDLETLKQWISEGAVLPTDKVSKGNLSWIDAGKAPMLKAVFSGDYTPSKPTEPPPAPPTDNVWQEQPQTAAPGPVFEAQPVSTANVCHNHADRKPHYLCRMCGAALCAECPKFVGGSKIPLCPLCGDLCHLFSEERSRTERSAFQGSGFGFGDFGRAIVYPLQHKTALLFGAALYGVLLLAGFRGTIAAWVIMFGCISHVISQVAWGRLDRSFMPDFSAFAIWDDVVVPCFLGIGIMIVTWGPIIALALALFFGVFGGPSLTQIGEKQLQSAQAAGPSQEDLAVLADPNADPKKLEEANRKLNQLRPGADIAREAEKSQNQQSDPTSQIRSLMPYLAAGTSILLLFLLGIVWAIFYYPMALAVAGYTQSLGSVINPLVGLDTIRRMGATYFKAFGMVILVQLVSIVVGIVVAVITSPFALPFVGNLPANFINGTFTFYFNLVIACLLGLSLYKCADRLGIDVD
jgi:hypothetical protein